MPTCVVIIEDYGDDSSDALEESIASRWTVLIIGRILAFRSTTLKNTRPPDILLVITPMMLTLVAIHV